MADSYKSIAEIANDEHMKERMRACATQQAHLGNAPAISNDPINRPNTWSAINWVEQNRYLWAASPSWGEKWDSALVSHAGETDYDPGSDEAVITDGDILAVIQSLTVME